MQVTYGNAGTELQDAGPGAIAHHGIVAISDVEDIGIGAVASYDSVVATSGNQRIVTPTLAAYQGISAAIPYNETVADVEGSCAQDVRTAKSDNRIVSAASGQGLGTVGAEDQVAVSARRC